MFVHIRVHWSAGNRISKQSTWRLETLTYIYRAVLRSNYTWSLYSDLPLKTSAFQRCELMTQSEMSMDVPFAELRLPSPSNWLACDALAAISSNINFATSAAVSVILGWRNSFYIGQCCCNFCFKTVPLLHVRYKSNLLGSTVSKWVIPMYLVWNEITPKASKLLVTTVIVEWNLHLPQPAPTDNKWRSL